MDDPHSATAVRAEDHNANRGVLFVLLLSAPAALAFGLGSLMLLGGVVCFVVEGADDPPTAVRVMVMAVLLVVLSTGLVHQVVKRRTEKYWFEIVCLLHLAAAAIFWLVGRLTGA